MFRVILQNISPGRRVQDELTAFSLKYTHHSLSTVVIGVIPLFPVRFYGGSSVRQESIFVCSIVSPVPRMLLGI